MFIPSRYQLLFVSPGCVISSSICTFQVRMAFVVFLRAVNVGGANVCRPAQLAKQLYKFGAINIGAAGTFVVRGNVNESDLRFAIARKLHFKCEIMICPAGDVLKLWTSDPFADEARGAGVTRFVSVVARRLRSKPELPLSLPSRTGWLLKVIDIRGRFVLGVYKREIKAISYLSQLEKQLGVATTTRSWNTVEKIAELLGAR